LILKAAEFAARKHRDQRRKDKAASPYTNHPILLAEVLSGVGRVTGTNTALEKRFDALYRKRP
jgi:guanosine-3',5'-bis(diphosphate) 3'-pyrophosphohydrolase